MECQCNLYFEWGALSPKSKWKIEIQKSQIQSNHTPLIADCSISVLEPEMNKFDMYSSFILRRECPRIAVVEWSHRGQEPGARGPG